MGFTREGYKSLDYLNLFAAAASEMSPDVWRSLMVHGTFYPSDLKWVFERLEQTVDRPYLKRWNLELVGVSDRPGNPWEDTDLFATVERVAFLSSLGGRARTQAIKGVVLTQVIGGKDKTGVKDDTRNGPLSKNIFFRVPNTDLIQQAKDISPEEWRSHTSDWPAPAYAQVQRLLDMPPEQRIVGCRKIQQEARPGNEPLRHLYMTLACLPTDTLRDINQALTQHLQSGHQPSGTRPLTQPYVYWVPEFNQRKTFHYTMLDERSYRNWTTRRLPLRRELVDQGLFPKFELLPIVTDRLYAIFTEPIPGLTLSELGEERWSLNVARACGDAYQRLNQRGFIPWGENPESIIYDPRRNRCVFNNPECVDESGDYESPGKTTVECWAENMGSTWLGDISMASLMEAKDEEGQLESLMPETWENFRAAQIAAPNDFSIYFHYMGEPLGEILRQRGIYGRIHEKVRDFTIDALGPKRPYDTLKPILEIRE